MLLAFDDAVRALVPPLVCTCELLFALILLPAIPLTPPYPADALIALTLLSGPAEEGGGGDELRRGPSSRCTCCCEVDAEEAE